MSGTFPSFAEFSRLARKGNVVPVYRPVLADLLSPVAAFLKIAPQTVMVANRRPDRASYSFLLESVEGGERVGRYTFFGVNPFQVLSSRETRIRIDRGTKHITETGNIFDYLRELGRAYHPVRLPGLPPFSAGAVGYLAHEVVRLIENLPPRVEPDVDMDDARSGLAGPDFKLAGTLIDEHFEA